MSDNEVTRINTLYKNAIERIKQHGSIQYAMNVLDDIRKYGFHSVYEEYKFQQLSDTIDSMI